MKIREQTESGARAQDMAGDDYVAPRVRTVHVCEWVMEPDLAARMDDLSSQGYDLNDPEPAEDLEVIPGEGRRFWVTGEKDVCSCDNCARATTKRRKKS